MNDTETTMDWIGDAMVVWHNWHTQQDRSESNSILHDIVDWYNTDDRAEAEERRRAISERIELEVAELNARLFEQLELPLGLVPKVSLHQGYFRDESGGILEVRKEAIGDELGSVRTTYIKHGEVK